MPYCTLQLSLPIYALNSSRRTPNFRPCFSRTACSSSNSSHYEDDDAGNGGNRDQPHLILVERYGNGTAKRYVVGDELQVDTFVEEPSSNPTTSRSSHFSNAELLWLPAIVKDFIFPAGFPGSVSDDYLLYMLLQFPTNVTAWICQTLVTSSLLKAVGVGSFSGSTAAASAAAIRWVSKDGIGAVGRLFIGGRFGNLFDDDPKQWRLYADFIGSAGSIFDLTTPLYPAFFLPLASLGNLTKAVARGLKDPSFRVIQSHFAISGNLGDVAAKEEVWEVTAQLLGLGLGILFLDTPGLVKSYSTLVTTWIVMRLLHLWLRYLSLSVLQFDSFHLGIMSCNKEENILLWPRFMTPRITFGVPLEEMIVGEKAAPMVKALLKLYSKEKYILVVNQQRSDFEVFVSFKVGATSMSVLRSVWQAYWLHENWNSSCMTLEQLSQSHLEMEDRFEDFILQLNRIGWDTLQINLKVPKEISLDEMIPI
ncbi:protein root UVB sensitive 5 isoform X2 [Argentina anserina]|uniref:protein root UVB sensitive 5 isoform X2 n=1 Tax=Argentina anserina TaxID=57926 RepID=UPI00217668BF|nr:protein root UVB sensitive 5 isoform X2 [Potentilla anserina]